MINRFTMSLVLAFASAPLFAQHDASQEIDIQVWQVISQSVIDRDIVAMGSTYHPDAVVVNAKETAPISSTLIRWGKGMEKELQEGSSARVSFRFSQRMINASSAFEEGIFKYVSINSEGIESAAYMEFEVLLVKKDGRWLTLMEHQLAETDQAAWDALK